MILKPLDYGRSFLTGKCSENEARFWVESRTLIIDERDGRMEVYIQCASCKSENTFVEENLFFKDNNYDYLPIFGPEYGLIFRRAACLTPDYRSCPKTEDMLGGQTYHLVESQSVEELTTAEDVLRATHNCYPLVAQTEIQNVNAGLRAVIEYPVKTMNTRRQGNVYQIDTGPVAFPDLGRRADRLIDTISLAFVAFNTSHSADFVVEVPILAGASQAAGGVQVYHYSRCISLTATNRLYALI